MIYAVDLDSTYSANLFNPLQIILTKGSGSLLWDTSGKEYIDFMTGYSSLVLGHCNPDLMFAAREQLETLTMTGRGFYNDVTPKFISELCVFTGFDKALVTNSGAEAIEAAIKIARLWGYRSKGVRPNKAKIVVFDGNFHGRTTTIVGFSSEEKYKDGFGPFDGGFIRVPFDDPEALAEVFRSNPDICAVLVEPIQGEAGIIVPDECYLYHVRRICNENHALLICDEIQSGLGRTGKMFAFEHDNIRPDLLVLGKGLGGGIVPISAVVGPADVMNLLEPGMHGSTFGGNPFACAIASEVLHQLRTTDVVQRSKILGDRFADRLMCNNQDLMNRGYLGVDYRQIGLWVAIELPPQIPGKEFAEELAHSGVLCRETHGQTLRIAPALNIPEDILNKGIEILMRELNDSLRACPQLAILKSNKS